MQKIWLNTANKFDQVLELRDKRIKKVSNKEKTWEVSLLYVKQRHVLI